MEVGTVLIMQSFGYGGISDAQVYDQDTALALQSEEQGFDHIWVVEHHFEDYAFCPDNFVYLANLAARTSRIKLATGAAILPWNSQPIRVAEKAALLDHLRGTFSPDSTIGYDELFEQVKTPSEHSIFELSEPEKSAFLTYAHSRLNNVRADEIIFNYL
ncbi:MAG: LLM class flavin-dependent oxidoreductase, partial [Pirellulaceae bacterium]